MPRRVVWVLVANEYDGRFERRNVIVCPWAEKLTELVPDRDAIPNAELGRLARVVGAGLPAAA